MNWQIVSALADVFGVVAILVSLIYLAVQIRQAKEQITHSIEVNQLAAFERTTESANRIRELFLLHPDLAKLYLEGRESFLGLSSSDKFKFSMLLRNMFTSMHAAYIRQMILKHDPLGASSIDKIADDILQYRGVREFLETYQPDWRSEFKDFIYERMKKIAKEKNG